MYILIISSALCHPACLNNGTCTSPGVCECEDGWEGDYCEQGKQPLITLSVGLRYSGGCGC